MKKNKFAFFVITFLIIFLVQPQNREFLVSTFTQNDFPSQFGFTNSAEEKNFEIENRHQNQNLELARKEFEGVQIIDVNPQSQFSNEELSLLEKIFRLRFSWPSQGSKCYVGARTFSK